MSSQALIFDLDGTAIPNSPDGRPSERVKRAVAQAQEKVLVACATGREKEIALPIIQELKLQAPCIIAGGSQIWDPVTEAAVWEELVTAEQQRQVVKLLQEYPYLMGAYADPGPEKLVAQYDYFFDKPIVYIMNIPVKIGEEMMQKLLTISDINVHGVIAWTVGNIDIHITSNKANKQHAMKKWLEIHSLQPSDILVVGDSNNDLPLFANAGLKVAMGNASDVLKAAADWVAPGVEEDGLAVTIEKFLW